MSVLLLGAGKGGAGVSLAPVTITSSSTFSAAENQTAVATLTATGGLGSFTWTKIGGADTAKFTLTSGGVLTFASAPDFETPTDANTDNVYLVQVQAADGVSTPATQTISVTVTNVAEALPNTFNPGDKASNITLSGDNLTVGATTSTKGAVRTIGAQTAGKFYFEVQWTGSPSGGTEDACGIVTGSASLTSGFLGGTTGGAVKFTSVGGNQIVINGSTQAGTNFGLLSAGQRICIAVDLVNQRIWFRNEGGNWNNSGTADPATNVGGFDISMLFTANAAFGMVTKHFVGWNATANFGATAAFAFTKPAGFAAWDGAVAAATGPARYWRILVSDTNGVAACSATKIELRETAGGATATGSGTASASSQFSGTYSADKAFDGNSGTFWVSSGAPVPYWIQYDFGSGITKTITEIVWQSRTDGFSGEAPKIFAIQQSNDGSTWQTAWSVTGQSGWSVGETRTFSLAAAARTTSQAATRTTSQGDTRTI